ncbi:collagen alpha-1(I) chain [Canis lupus dingo]|uniref:collagen alpha-1(I) chain n=1 Tax=Canis lupus dingo TaxID=286419 RepID=UPI0020C40A13|nr:collagen alpha-1(I) chain [Canis lupus dingo]
MSGAAGRCVGPSRPGRGRGQPWGRRCPAGTPRGRGAGRRARGAAWEARCVSADGPPGFGQPPGTGAAAGAAGAGGPEAAGSPGAAAPVARAPGVVWVDGAVGEPQVVGPVGSVWVTGAGREAEREGAAGPSPRGCERKGRPGSAGHESILELWLKVQAVRAASGCGAGSRVQLHPVPVEGPLERGIPGRASWVETSRAGLTGPWVKGQDGVAPRAPGRSAAPGPGAGWCGQQQAVGLHPGGVPTTLATSCGLVPHMLGRGQAVGVPRAPGWPEAMQREVGCPWDRGQSALVPRALAGEAVCGDTPGLWGSGQAARVPHAVGAPRGLEGEATLAAALDMWRRMQAAEEMGSGVVPGIWGTGQPVGVPCATAEETRCGGDPGFRDREQTVWVETGSGGDPGPWAAMHAAEMCGHATQEVGSGGAPGPWGVGPGMGKDTGCGSVPGLWGAEQPVGVSQAVLLPGALGDQAGYGGTTGPWERQQALGVPPADAVPGVPQGDTGNGNVGLWERRQAVGEQDALATALEVPGAEDQEAGCGDMSCLCRRRQVVGSSGPQGMPEAAVLPKHRCALAGVPAAVGVPGPGRGPAAVWVSGPACREDSSSEVWNLWSKVHDAAGPVAPGGLWSVGEDAGSAAFPRPWGRRQALGVPAAPGLVGEETGSGDVPRSWARRPSTRAPGAAEPPAAAGEPDLLGVEAGSGAFSGLPERRLTAGVSAAGGVPVAPRTLRPAWEECTSAGVAGLWGQREAVPGHTDTWAPTGQGVPSTIRMPGPRGDRLGPGVPSGLLGRQAAEVPVMLADAGSRDASGAWGQRGVTEVAATVGAAGPVDGTVSAESLWRRASGSATEAAQVPVSLGVLAAVGVPTMGRVPAAVWVTGCVEEEGASGEEAGAPSLEPPGESQAAGLSPARSYRTGSWNSGRPDRGEPELESVGTGSGPGTIPRVAPGLRLEGGRGRLRDHPQQGGGGASGREPCGGGQVEGGLPVV